MKWECIIFDLDGTLMDTSRGIIKAIDYTIYELGLPQLEDEKKRKFIGPPIYESFAKEYGLTSQEASYATEVFRNVYKDKYLFEAIPYPGIIELVDKLRKAGCKLAVATNKRHDYTMTLLDHFDFSSRFDFILGSDSANKLSKADIIVQCMNKLGVENIHQTIMVGDTISDYVGAQKVGINFIGISYGFGFHEDNNYENIDRSRIFSSVDALTNFLMDLQ